MREPSTVIQLLEIAERVLSDSTHIFEDHDNRREAEELLAHCLDIDTDDLQLDEQVGRRTRERYLSLVARRAAGEPFPYLTGYITFYGLDMKVKRGLFVPRPSSELTVDRALRRLRRKRSPIMVDVCTGAGPIAMAVADELGRGEVWGADISSEHLALARRNAKELGIDNVHFRRCDMYDGLPERLRGSVDVVTGHVPYVPPDEVDDLPSEVKDFEPLDTLTDHSDDGLTLMRRAVHDAGAWLKPGGWLLLEVSEDLVPKMRRLCREARLGIDGVASDDDGLSVVVEARAPE